MNEADHRPSLPRSVDAVVVGGGHAGVEAAWALGRCGHTVALVTFDANGLARMPCNPSIGGLAKGQLVREIDALGGLMGRLIDRTGIHFRMLNRGKGPAVHAPRAQADKVAYSCEALSMLRQVPAITVIEAEVTEIVTERVANGRVCVAGVRIAPSDPARGTTSGTTHGTTHGVMELAARAVIVTTGTFLDGILFTGMEPRPGGRRAEPSASGLAACLRGLGLQFGRLKTGTPPRLRRTTIDLDALVPQPGDEPPPRFSFYAREPVHNRVLCHLTRTNERTHAVVRGALDRSPLYGGMIRGIGPRYCPSLEDKVVRFPERSSHPIFLEPEGIASETIYPNGISTSLPADVQLEMVRTIPGLEHAEIVHPGYAVEYDFIHTSQLNAGLGVRGIEGLWTAGQINGTSGYEEAAAQGLVAGLAVVAQLERRAPLALKRSDAYIGVLIDDLITKVPTEPYRMFTSQSEYRLLLRQDNADRRLSAHGVARGLVSQEDYAFVKARWDRLAAARRHLQTTRVARDGGPMVATGDVGRTLEEVLRRPGISLRDLAEWGYGCSVSDEDAVTLEADIKYAGYIERLTLEIAQRESMEDTLIPDVLLADPPRSLSREARECLDRHRPRTLGQATRIPGITPCDISLLAVRIHALQVPRERQ
jgi:tRNA uridine 5-carboxymethylaminomethyl modification enzyme